MPKLFLSFLLLIFFSILSFFTFSSKAYAACVMATNPYPIVAGNDFELTVVGIDYSYPDNLTVKMSRNTGVPEEFRGLKKTGTKDEWKGTFKTSVIGTRTITIYSGTRPVPQCFKAGVEVSSGSPPPITPGVTNGLSFNTDRDVINQGDVLDVSGNFNTTLPNKGGLTIYVWDTATNTSVGETKTDNSGNYSLTTKPIQKDGKRDFYASVMGTMKLADSPKKTITVNTPSSGVYIEVNVKSPAIYAEGLDISGKVGTGYLSPSTVVKLEIFDGSALQKTISNIPTVGESGSVYRNFTYKTQSPQDLGLENGKVYTLKASSTIFGESATGQTKFTPQEKAQTVTPIITPPDYRTYNCDSLGNVGSGTAQCLKAGGVQCDPETGREGGVGGVSTAIGCIPTDPPLLIKKLLQFATGAGGGIALLLMIFGAFQWITSTGNPDSMKKAQDQFTNAAIGLLFIIFSIMILKIIGVDILQIPGFTK